MSERTWAALSLKLIPGSLLLLAALSLLPVFAQAMGRADQVQNITTHVLTNGNVVVNKGSGIVLGDLFVTALHNLDPKYRGEYEAQSYLEGIRVWPLLIDEDNDLAVIRIPADLCSSWCNDHQRGTTNDIGLQQSVEWVRKIEPGTTWKSARVLSLTAPVRPARARTECAAGLVVEVSQPFIPGSSGTAVWDALTHELLGMAQGSYVLSSGQHSGYFKPMRCIYEYLDAAGISHRSR